MCLRPPSAKLSAMYVSGRSVFGRKVDRIYERRPLDPVFAAVAGTAFEPLDESDLPFRHAALPRFRRSPSPAWSQSSCCHGSAPAGSLTTWALSWPLTLVFQTQPSCGLDVVVHPGFFVVGDGGGIAHALAVPHQRHWADEGVQDREEDITHALHSSAGGNLPCHGCLRPARCAEHEGRLNHHLSPAAKEARGLSESSRRDIAAGSSPSTRSTASAAACIAKYPIQAEA